MQANKEDEQAIDKFNNLLNEYGYDTTLDDVLKAFDTLKQNSLLPWIQQYKVSIDSKEHTLNILGILFYWYFPGFILIICLSICLHYWSNGGDVVREKLLARKVEGQM